MNQALRLILICSLAPFLASCDRPTVNTVETESEIFTMERIYKSMFGPEDRDRLKLLETESPEVLWVTAVKASMVGDDGETPQSPEFFCHSVLRRLETQKGLRRQLLGRRLGGNRKMFTLVQGLPEIRFPDGFGMPVLTNDTFVSVVMVMNPAEQPEPVRVGVDSRIEYVRESEAKGSIKPLYLVPLVVSLPVDNSSSSSESSTESSSEAGEQEAYGGEFASHDTGHSSHEEEEGESCLAPDEGRVAARTVDLSPVDRSAIIDSDTGAKETGHWYVPPGRHVYRHEIGREYLDSAILFDTRAHYIAAHLHPFGESIELIDLTTGESVFKSVAHNYPDRIAIEEITHYSSTEGIPIYADHDYALEAVYNNTTSGDVDSMAVMYLYLEDTNRPYTPKNRI